MENLAQDEFAQIDNATNSSSLPDSAMMIQYKAAVILWKVWTPCVILLGNFGNIATIFVMRRIKDHNSSQYAILMALAISDLLILDIGALRIWIRHMFSIEIRLFHPWICKLHKWLIYSVSTTSSWLLTCVTVQRTMAVLWPHKMRMIWTVRHTWIVIATLVITGFIFQAHFIFGFEITRENTCDSVPGWYNYFYRKISMWLDTVVSILIPCACLFICDTVLSFTLFKAPSISTTAITTTSKSNNAHSKDSRRKRASRTTLTVLILCFTFLVLTVPLYIFYGVWHENEEMLLLETPEVLANLKLVSTVAHLMWYTNSAINFLLYCLTGTKYRQEFLNWILCRPPSAVSAVGTGAGRGKQQDNMQLSSST